MKKLLVLCLTVIMMLSLSLNVFAAGGFVSSPSSNQAPELIEFDNESDACLAEIIITAYANRAQLPDDIRKMLEDAYNIIVDIDDLSKLNSKIAELAKNNGVNVSDLAVSDLFDISRTGCDNHENHGKFTVKLNAETLKNFICLLHYYNGEWQIVDNAKVTDNGDSLEFTADEFSPFAIVVNTGKTQSVAPQTNDNGIVYVYAAIAFVSAFVTFFAVKGSRRKTV